MKNGEVEEGFSAKGIAEAKEKLDTMKLSDEERRAYQAYEKHIRDIASEQHTKMADAKELIDNAVKKAKEQKDIDAVLGLLGQGIPNEVISKALNIQISKVDQIISENKK